MGSFWKLWDLGFLIQTFAFLQSGSFPFRTCVRDPHFRKTCICREIKSIIVLKDFSVSCVSFKEMFSVHYGKCLNLTYPEWNRQVWKFNILWASCKTKLSALLHARHREICLDICWEALPQFRFKNVTLFLIYLNGQNWWHNHCIWSSTRCTAN